MSKLRSVNTHFWSDNYVIDLDPTEKLLFLYLLTNENTNMLGVYEMHVRKMAFDTGIDKDMILKIFDRFKRDGKGSYVDGFVVLDNFLKHQRMNDNMKKSAVSSFKELPEHIQDHECVSSVREYLSDISDEITSRVIDLTRREAMYVKYRGVCQYCDKELVDSQNIEVDHIEPLSKGGSDTYKNMVLSCRDCNQEKLDRTPQEMGWEIPSSGNYHFNIARKDLQEIKWLRDRFNDVFHRQLCLNGDELTEVNHKHTLNKPFKKEEEEKELEREIEEEEETDPIPSNIPTKEEVKAYFKENGYDPNVGEQAYNYYNTSIEDNPNLQYWRDSKGNKVKNWKMKMRAVWFKDEHKLSNGNSNNDPRYKVLN